MAHAPHDAGTTYYGTTYYGCTGYMAHAPHESELYILLPTYYLLHVTHVTHYSLLTAYSYAAHGAGVRPARCATAVGLASLRQPPLPA
eukprot:scaffold72300_cov45-Phaeocystis_antarctica.AAC.1